MEAALSNAVDLRNKMPECDRQGLALVESLEEALLEGLEDDTLSMTRPQPSMLIDGFDAELSGKTANGQLALLFQRR